ncbi:MAG: AMP-binding protein, partial [Bacteroidales bacterium]|nr:AMP-binding protein [Bacteroidales bacterium]
MLSQSEIEKIENFTGIKTDYPADKSIAGLFEEIVALYPNNPAVFFKGRTVTYDQLNSKADDLANVLIENGIKKNMSVAILTEKSFENIIGILGILKAGGVYVPIDPLYPCERINFILKDSACRILLTQHKFDDLILNVLFRLYLDQPLTVISGLKKLPPDSSPSDLAYIMYTSGTTGIPKGVMVTQKGVVRLVKNTNYLNIDPSDRVAFINAVIFDASTFELWGTLLNGACLFIIDKKTVLDPDLLGKMLLSNNITISLFTGSLFNKIFEFRDDIFSGLNYLLVGGEVLSPSHINAVRRSNPDLKVINVYGPTENTTFSTTYLIEEDFDKNIPIGKPVSNSTAYIFDEGMNYTPVGVIGELYLGGDGLSIGYLNRDDLNERSFVEHP